MRSPVPIRESLAAKYLLTIHDRDADGAELQRAMAWIEASPENQEAFERAQAFWRLCDDADVEAERAADCAPARRRSASKPAGFLAVAVAAVLCVGALVWFAASHPPLGLGHGAGSGRYVYSTSAGEIRDVRLPDGSVVTLAGASSISVRSTPRRREIVLADGEAIFNVAADPKRPFVVLCGTGSATALGTRFSVRRDLEGVTVTLADGELEVATNGETGPPVVLTPGSQVRYTASGRLQLVKDVNADMAMAWRNGKLYFVNESLESIVFELNRYSSKPVVIEDAELRPILISGIAKSDSIPEWLRGVAKVTDIKLVESDKAIRLSSGGKSRRAAAEPYKPRWVSPFERSGSLGAASPQRPHSSLEQTAGGP